MIDLYGVSGLAMVFFSKDPKDTNARYKSPDGRVWTYLLRWVFSTMIVSGRADLQSVGSDVEPLWLKAFADPT